MKDKKWEMTGCIVEVLPNRQYSIHMCILKMMSKMMSKKGVEAEFDGLDNLVYQAIHTTRHISPNRRQSPNGRLNVLIKKQKFHCNDQISHKLSFLLSKWLRFRPMFRLMKFKEGHIFHMKHQRNYYFKDQKELVTYI